MEDQQFQIFTNKLKLGTATQSARNGIYGGRAGDQNKNKKNRNQKQKTEYVQTNQGVS